MSTKKVLRRNTLRKRIRRKIAGTSDCPRLSVFRSNKQIYAQIIDDSNGHTLCQFSSSESKQKVNKIEQARTVGLGLAKVATGAGITKVVFDRGGYLYHGRVKSLAEAAREGGLKF